VVSLVVSTRWQRCGQRESDVRSWSQQLVSAVVQQLLEWQHLQTISMLSLKLPCVFGNTEHTCGEGIQKHLVDVHDGRSQPVRRVLCLCDIVKGLSEELSCHFGMGRLSRRCETVVGKNGECRALRGCC
jgi:hypothetical protein